MPRVELMRPITIPEIRARKTSSSTSARGYKQIAEPLVAVTAYDFTFARIADDSGVDIVLVGDSLGMVIQGGSTTLPVTLEEMVYHTRCVSRGVSRALLVADMPFLSYQSSIQQAIESAGKFLKEGNAAAVKIEGGVAIAETVDRLVSLDIPVMGHIGMTPQSVHRMGGFRMQGRERRQRSAVSAGTRDQILDDARALVDAGVFAIVLEAIPGELAQTITETCSVPTIGIGAGPRCDGQILVSYDLLGLTQGHLPSFVKQFGKLGEDARVAFEAYADEVRKRSFPAATEPGTRVKPRVVSRS